MQIKGDNRFILQPVSRNMNEYQAIASLHMGQALQSAHEGAAFLPWHRIYILL